MTKKDLIKEFDRLIAAHHDNEIDSKDEWLREIIWLKDEVIKKLTISAVVGQSDQLPPNSITDKEYKKLVKSLYPKDNSKRFRR